jgi:DNA-binding NtrC family response regulator
MSVQRVLIVDDEHELRVLLGSALIAAGYDIDVAAGVEEAQALLAKGRYALVIADWWLSDGIGMTIVDEAADLGAKTILMSGYVQQLLGDKTRHTLLRKPLSPSDFVAAVRQAVGNPAVTAEKSAPGAA